jgi:hypothetical protein
MLLASLERRETMTGTLTTLAEEHITDAAYWGDRPDWVIACAQHRDSDTVARSNWAAFVEALGGESETVAIERSNHWAVGWMEYLVIDPVDTERVQLAEQLREQLEDYPLLDEEAYSKLEWEEYQEAWSDYGQGDFAKALVREFGLSQLADDLLCDAPGETLLEFYESLIPSGEYYIPDGSSVRLNIDYAIKRCTRKQMADFLRSL